MRRLGGFAGNVFGENLLYQAGRNLGHLLIGRALGAGALGAFALATNVILVPFARMAGPLQQVFFPAFSRMDGDRERIADIWIRASRLVGAFAIPALVGLVIVAPDFVQVVLGPNWARATPVIQILAWVGLIQALQTLSGEVLLALGQAGTLLRFTALWFVVTVGAFVLGIQWGIVGVAACYAIATTLSSRCATYLTTRALGISFLAIPEAFSGVAQATAVMAAVLVAVRAGLVSAGRPARCAPRAPRAARRRIYVGRLPLARPEVTREIRGVLRRRRRHRKAAVAEPLARDCRRTSRSARPARRTLAQRAWAPTAAPSMNPCSTKRRPAATRRACRADTARARGTADDRVRDDERRGRTPSAPERPCHQVPSGGDLQTARGHQPHGSSSGLSAAQQRSARAGGRIAMDFRLYGRVLWRFRR